MRIIPPLPFSIPILKLPLTVLPYLSFQFGTTTHNVHYITTIHYAFHSLHWELFRPARPRSQLARTRITKLLYDLFPTRYRQHKTGVTVTPKCHYCRHDDTFVHQVRCPQSQHTSTTGTSLSTSINDISQRTVAPPNVTAVLLTIVQQWFQRVTPGKLRRSRKQQTGS